MAGRIMIKGETMRTSIDRAASLEMRHRACNLSMYPRINMMRRRHAGHATRTEQICRAKKMTKGHEKRITEDRGDGVSINDRWDSSKGNLNNMCNETVKAILQNDNDNVLDLQFQIEDMLKDSAGQSDDDICLLNALYDLLCNKLPSQDQIASLGLKNYEAFHKVFSIIEDSGWQLANEEGGEEQQTLSSLSDDIMQPPLTMGKSPQ